MVTPPIPPQNESLPKPLCSWGADQTEKVSVSTITPSLFSGTRLSKVILICINIAQDYLSSVRFRVVDTGQSPSVVSLWPWFSFMTALQLEEKQQSDLAGDEEKECLFAKFSLYLWSELHSFCISNLLTSSSVMKMKRK